MGPWGLDPAAAAARMQLLLHVAAAAVACPGPAVVLVACPRGLGVCWGLLRCRRWSVLAWAAVAGLAGAAVLACVPCQGLLLLLLLLLAGLCCCRSVGCRQLQGWGRSQWASASAALGCLSQMLPGLVILIDQHC